MIRRSSPSAACLRVELLRLAGERLARWRVPLPSLCVLDQPCPVASHRLHCALREGMHLRRRDVEPRVRSLQRHLSSGSAHRGLAATRRAEESVRSPPPVPSAPMRFPRVRARWSKPCARRRPGRRGRRRRSLASSGRWGRPGARTRPRSSRSRTGTPSASSSPASRPRTRGRGRPASRGARSGWRERDWSVARRRRRGVGPNGPHPCPIIALYRT